jgi:hypothetical protein
MVVAEKLQAFVSPAIVNTLPEGFFDAWTLAQTQEFEGATVAEPIGATFARRSTPLPGHPPLAPTDAFGRDPEKQAQWRSVRVRSHVAGPPEDLALVAERIAELGSL